MDGASQSHILSNISMTSPRYETSTVSLSSIDVGGFQYLIAGLFNDGSYWREK